MRTGWRGRMVGALAVGVGLGGGSGGQVTASAAPLLSPLESPAVLTSSFGEYRAGHYHAGLDYSTGGREGLPVHAPASGWVSRVRASGVGYGRVLYLHLADGRVAVLAHLSRFHPLLEARVRAEQDRQGRYEVDFELAAGTLPFAAGEVVAYTGSSGAGPPHLHAELRTGEDASIALDPLKDAWPVADSLAPRLTRVRVEPARAGVRVNGGTDPVILDLTAPEVGERLRVSGPVRLWVEAEDRSGAGAHRLVPGRIEQWVDGELAARVDLSRVDWRWPREVEWTFLNAAARERDERWVNLDPAPRGHQTVAERRVPSVPGSSGVHRWTLRAVDRSGNTAAVDVPFRLDPDPEPAPAPGGARTWVGIDLRSRGTFLEGHLPEAEKGAALHLVSPSGVSMPMPGAARFADGLFQLEAPPGREPGLWRFEFEFQTELAVWADTLPGKPTRADAPCAVLELGPDAPFDPLWITVRRGDLPRPVPELAPVTPVVSLGPWATPLRDRARVTLLLPAALGSRRGLAVYRRAPEGWSFEGADTSGTGVATEIFTLEDLAVFRDETPPSVVIDPVRGETRPNLEARIRDEGAGVTWRTLFMRLDGELLIAEWDADAGRLRAHLRRDVASGAHELAVTAADRVGNSTTTRASFLVP